jgi:hypothetical protein
MTSEIEGNQEITLSDLRNQLDHVDAVCHENAQRLEKIIGVLTEFEPLLTVIRGSFAGTRPDMVGVAQLGRSFRKRRG